jgi:ATP-binding cassette subfamily B protein
MGNENSSDLCLQSIRERIFIVPQNVDILSTSLMSNIALGEFSPNIERVVHACEMAGVMPFVNSMPEGLYTHIGERGASLSGGEKQKIAIARAIYRDPEVFVFDEATAFLDNKFEAFFISLILKLKEMGKTIIIISHNIVHAIHADRIAVLDAGVVVQEGSYEELTSIPGKFREIAAFELSTRTQRDKLKILNFL